MFALAILASAHVASAQSEPETTGEIELFSRRGCTRCDAAESFLRELSRRRPALRVREHDIVSDLTALERLRALTLEAGVDQVGVPSVYVRGRLFIGFDAAATTGADIERWLVGVSATNEIGAPAAACEAEGETCPPDSSDRVRIAWLGELDVRALGLPLFTVVLGLIDGFNPCAMWVLLFVLSMLVHLKDRTRMAWIGGTFVLVSGLVYFAFMAAWLNVFLLVGLSRAIQRTLGVVAVLIGSVHIKDFFAFQRGVSLSIPESAKPGIYRRAREVLHAQNMTGALAGIVVLAVLVNSIELLCTAGLPAIYTQVLAAHGVSTAGRYAYLALYNIAYMLDDSVMLLLAVITLSHRKLQERGGRILKLVSGGVIVALGLLLLFAPQWLAW